MVTHDAKLHGAECCRVVFVVLLFVLTIRMPAALAQQNEIPPTPPDVSAAGDSENPGDPLKTERIVEKRPPFYNVRRALHPVSWVQAGVRPVLRMVEGIGVDNVASETKSPRVSGIKFGIQGLGSGSAFGPKVTPFHNNVFNKGIEVEVPLVVTYRFYESARFRANYPLISNGPVDRLGIELVGDYSSRPADKFFGMGNDSPLENEARFRSVSRGAGLALETRVNSDWTVRMESGYRSVGITRPRVARSAMEVFRTVDIPGLTSDPGVTMVVTTALLQRNTKNHPHVPDSGGLQRFEATLNEGHRGGDFSYWRYRADLQQFFPLSQDRRKVVAVRASVETNQEKGGSKIPFFDLPTIGGRSSIRGIEGRRFVDRSAMDVSLEYRYRIWRYFDWALFVDSGQVAPEIGNFAWDRLHTGYGTRFIVRPQGKHAVSLDIARSGNMWGVYVDFSPDF